MVKLGTTVFTQGKEFSFFKLYFIVYVITIVPISPLASLPPAPPPTPSGSPHTGSCPWVMCVGSLATPFPIVYFTSPWLFCNYLFVLISSHTSSPIPHNPHLYGNHQNTLCIHVSDSGLIVCLVSFLYSIVDSYEFINILLFIVLIFFFLNKFL